MVTYAQLVGMNTSKLTKAADESGTVSSAMSRNGEDVRKKSRIPANVWQGADADAASGLLGKFPDPLFDVSDGFNSAKGTLHDLVTDVNKAKEHLQGANDAIAGTGIKIHPDGTVETPVVKSPQEAQDNDRKAQDARRIIDEALKMAGDADNKASDRLSTLSKDADAAYMAVPGKGEALKRAKDLLNTPFHELDEQEARELNTILSSQKNDPVFARKLMEDLGPKGLLDASGKFSQHGANLAKGGDEVAAQAFKDLQRHLGETLGTATQNGGLGQQWTQQLMDLGAAPMENNPGHNGYAALAPLLEHGSYDKSFLAPVAEHMTRLNEAAATGQTGALSGPQGGFGNPYVIDQDAQLRGRSPLDSMLTALNHSPEAAADYFADDNSEHGLNYADGAGQPLEAVKGGNAPYLLDMAARGGDAINPDTLGNALEAGATGVPGDAPADTPRPERTEDMARTAESVVHHLGEKYPVALSPGGELEAMADNATDIAANYMPDIHNSLVQPGGFTDVHLDPNGANANFSPVDSRRLLESLGQHQGSLETLMGANDVAQGSMVSQGYDRYGADESWVGRALEPGSTVAEVLGNAAGDQIEQNSDDADEARNKGIDLGASGAKIAASAIPAPVVSGALSETLEHLKDGLQVDNSTSATYQAMQTEQGVSDHYATYTTRMFESLLERGDLSPEEADALRGTADEQIRQAYPPVDQRPPEADGGN